MKRWCIGLLLLVAAAGTALAHTAPAWLSQVGFDPHPGAQAPLQTLFRDEQGRIQPLGHYFLQRPVVLVLGYYNCKNLCSVVMKGLLTRLKQAGLNPGQDYELVAVSIDPRETPAMAADRKAMDAQMVGMPGHGWHFLTGPAPAIRVLANQVGFRYVYDKQNDQFAHAAGAMILTPKGRISQYFYGVDFAPRALRLALVEAASARIGSPVDYLLLLCCRFNPQTGRYSMAILDGMRVLGGATVLVLAGTMLRMRRQAVRRGQG